MCECVRGGGGRVCVPEIVRMRAVDTPLTHMTVSEPHKEQMRM